MLKGSLIWAGVGYAITEVVDNWETFKTRILGIFDELKRAAPVWLGGHGEGWGALGSNPRGLSALPGVAQSYGNDWGTWLRDLPPYTWLYGSGLMRRPLSAAERATEGLDLADAAEGAAARQTTVTVTGNPITIYITTPPGADASAIGAAAGNAVGSALRGVMSDIPPGLGSMGVP
jgi:hypothetical protein